MRANRNLFAESSSEECSSDASHSQISEESDCHVPHINENNSNHSDPDNSDFESTSVFPNLFQSADGTVWSSHPFVNEMRPGKTGAANLLREHAGPRKHVVERCVTPVGALSCFFTDEILLIIIHSTNEEGRRVYNENWNEMDYVELIAFLGLLILTGVYRSRSEPVSHLWNTESGRPIFSKAMARNRFTSIQRCLRFDSRDDRVQRRVQSASWLINLLRNARVNTSQGQTSALMSNYSFFVDAVLSKCTYQVSQGNMG